jgi:hypothetical protein
VTWILHLSDPHLGAANVLDDEKDQVEGQPDLETSERVFLRTMATLESFVADHGRPAACIVSGDLTFRANPAGFELFPKMLDDFSGLLPEQRSEIVVVPGNHDVAWEEDPGSPERYAGFLGATRARGCTTPLIDGIDLEPESGKLRDSVESGDHHLESDRLLVVPINSSNYCGVITKPRGGLSEEEWRAALEPLGEEREKLLADLRKSRQVDMARVSRAQIEALGSYFDKCGLERSGRADPRLRVVVIHHQLLPVSVREERKAYEALVNLGLVRETLRAYGFRLLLHGHKHHSGIYWDALSVPGSRLTAQPANLLVISSPGEFDVGAPVMRAVKLLGSASGLNLGLHTFAGASPQRKRAHVIASETVPLWRGIGDADVADEPSIIAPNSHTAYARLRAMFALRGGRPHSNLHCLIEDPADAGELPPDYPAIGIEDRQAWFEDLVSWWQKPRPELVARGLMPFNHGERIRERWGDQIERAICMLQAREGSSRALVALLAPRETGRYPDDARDLKKGSFPAFTMAEFAIRREDEEAFLDCFGYFRKQEMQFWWPVNLAELAYLQQCVREGLGAAFKRGKISTFAATAQWGKILPGVAVPIVDRYIESPERLFQMALAVAFPESASAEDRKTWHQVLADLAGSENSQPPLASAGVRELRGYVSRLAQPSEEDGVAAIDASLAGLLDQYDAHAGKDKLSGAASKVVGQSVEAVRKAVVAVIGEEDVQ